jgi:hypothetical protein
MENQMFTVGDVVELREEEKNMLHWWKWRTHTFKVVEIDWKAYQFGRGKLELESLVDGWVCYLYERNVQLVTPRELVPLEDML